MYDDEFELTFNLQDEDAAPVELPKAAEEAGPEAPAETREPAADEEPTIVLPDRRPEPAAEAAAPDMPQPEAPAAPEPQPEAPPRLANGRCVLISGGDRGIGAAAARAFYAAGDRVAVFYHTNADAAAALEQELPGCIAIQCDVASRASCEVAFHAAEQALGRVDVLVSNAGIAQQKLFTDITPEEWQHMLDVNLTGEEMGLLIGKRGQTLDSLQYLVSLVVNKESEDYLRVKLDTENYRERRKETLETLAKNIAYKVKRTRRPVSLEPMNPYERRIIHSALQNDKYVFTKSEGEEPFRHVVIALKKEERRERRPRYERRERTAGSENSYRSSSQE